MFVTESSAQEVRLFLRKTPQTGAGLDVKMRDKELRENGLTLIERLST